MLNLTPHPIVLMLDEGDLTIPPSGNVARVSVHDTPAGEVCIADLQNDEAFNVPVCRRVYGEPEGLPAEGVPCIVSALVAAAVPGRRGVFSPDTGAGAVRDAQGRIIGVRGLITA